MNPESGSKTLTDVLNNSIDALAKEVLLDLTRWEFDQLAERDPSFEDVAKQARQSLLVVDEIINKENGQTHPVVYDFKELVLILEEAANSIVKRNSQLLIDSIWHLNEFVEIRAKKGAEI